MFTYQILVEYDGSELSGWQIQKNAKSIQEILEKILKKILKKKIKLFGSGRTDKGVHATEQSAHFRLNFEIKDKDLLLKSLNFFLKNYNISILDIKKKSKNFHARYHAKLRTYKYIIVNRSADLILDKGKAWHIKKKLDINLMRKGGKLLLGTKDFSTFRSSSCNAKSAIKTMKIVKIKKIKDKIEIYFTSESFLQQQVRSMVGCLKYLGEKKWNLEKFKKIIFLKKRSNCAPPAPPYGLYLTKVQY